MHVPHPTLDLIPIALFAGFSSKIQSRCHASQKFQHLVVFHTNAPAHRHPCKANVAFLRSTARLELEFHPALADTHMRCARSCEQPA